MGLSMAGFKHIALVEYESLYCGILKHNRPDWNVICSDVKNFSGQPFFGKIDLLAGGVPCPPFSVAGKQLGKDDERDLFPDAIRLIKEIMPRAVMLENVKGFLDSKFENYRTSILKQIESLGYAVHIKLINASGFSVPQLRPRTIIIGIRNDIEDVFAYPEPCPGKTATVGETLSDLMKKNGWEYADEWAKKANAIAPTIVGGSKKHGGPDLGPARARKAWSLLGINGLGIADDSPFPGFKGMPKLTPRMVARLQGFPDDWYFGTKKTAACRMIGNAFPPPVAKAIGLQLLKVLQYGSTVGQGT